MWFGAGRCSASVRQSGKGKADARDQGEHDQDANIEHDEVGYLIEDIERGSVPRRCPCNKTALILSTFKKPHGSTD